MESVLLSIYVTLVVADYILVGFEVLEDRAGWRGRRGAK